MYGSPDMSENCHQGYIGDVAHDTLALGGHSATVPLVSITEIQSGFQEAPCSGIMGVAFSALNDLAGSMSDDDITGETDEADAFGTFLTGAGLANEFSLCMGTPSNPGTLVLGGTDSQYYTGEFQTVEIQPGGYYGVPVTGLSLLGQSVGGVGVFSGVNSIVDSGTSSLMLPSEVYSALSMSTASCSADTDCVLRIEMSGGVTLEAPELMICSEGACAASNWIQDGGSQAIVGYAVIRNYYTHFDRAAMTIGFAAATSACADDALPTLSSSAGVGKQSNSGENDEYSSVMDEKDTRHRWNNWDRNRNRNRSNAFPAPPPVENSGVADDDTGGKDLGGNEDEARSVDSRIPRRTVRPDASDSMEAIIVTTAAVLVLAILAVYVVHAQRTATTNEASTEMTEMLVPDRAVGGM